MPLTITIPPADDLYDERTNQFISFPGATLTLEHSLVSLAKWESRWHKPFLSQEEKTNEETYDYIKCMTINKNISDETYLMLTNDNIETIKKYIDDPMTATTFSSRTGGSANREVITSEIIYYWMIALQIPFECQKWHLERLLTLIRVCEIKNNPGKKMSKGDLMRRNSALNAARKQKLNTKG